MSSCYGYNGYDEDSQSDTFSSSYSNDTSEWCFCGDCVYLMDRSEQTCCHSHPCILKTMDEYGVDCITNHPGFQSVVLDPYVLETAYYSYRKTKYRRGKLSIKERSNYRMYRYTAYRQLVRWCWGILGDKNRVNLPACAIAAIRKTFNPGYAKLPEYY